MGTTGEWQFSWARVEEPSSGPQRIRVALRGLGSGHENSRSGTTRGAGKGASWYKRKQVTGFPEGKRRAAPSHPSGRDAFSRAQSGGADLMQHRGTELHFPRVQSERSEAHRLVSFSHVRLQPWEEDRGSFPDPQPLLRRPRNVGGQLSLP